LSLKNFFYSVLLIELIPLIFCIYFRKKINTKALKVFFIYTGFLALFALVALTLIYFDFKPSYLLINLNIYLIFEYCVLSFFFYYLLKNPAVKKVIVFIIPVFILLVLFFFYKKSGSYAFILEFFIFLMILIFYFYEKMKIVTTFPLYQSVSFWLCVGLFIYFTGNFFFLLFIKNTDNKETRQQLQVICYIVDIAKDIILSLAWLAHEPTAEENTELRIPDDVHLDDEFTFTNKSINP
jgi:hypothetical protein